MDSGSVVGVVCYVFVLIIGQICVDLWLQQVFKSCRSLSIHTGCLLMGKVGEKNISLGISK